MLATIPMSDTWKLCLLYPEPTQGIELSIDAFIVRKVSKSMLNMWPYIGKELRLFFFKWT